jgi:hypothetical protein
MLSYISSSVQRPESPCSSIGAISRRIPAAKNIPDHVAGIDINAALPPSMPQNRVVGAARRSCPGYPQRRQAMMRPRPAGIASQDFHEPLPGKTGAGPDTDRHPPRQAPQAFIAGFVFSQEAEVLKRVGGIGNDRHVDIQSLSKSGKLYLAAALVLSGKRQLARRFA